jgi:hypothetical protein
MVGKNIKQLMDKIKNIPIILDWEGNPKDDWPKIHEAITPSEAVKSTVMQERQHSARISRRLKRTPVKTWRFLMANKCIKDS